MRWLGLGLEGPAPPPPCATGSPSRVPATQPWSWCTMSSRRQPMPRPRPWECRTSASMCSPSTGPASPRRLRWRRRLGPRRRWTRTCSNNPRKAPNQNGRRHWAGNPHYSPFVEGAGFAPKLSFRGAKRRGIWCGVPPGQPGPTTPDPSLHSG